MMKALLIKDVMLFKKQFRFFVFIVIVMLVSGLAFENNMSFVIAYLTLMLSIFTISTITYDEYESGYVYLFAMPVSRKLYVAEKYVFGFGTMSVTVIVMSIILMAANMIRQAGYYDSGEWKIAVAASCIVTVVMLSVTIPAQLRFGSDKGRIVLMGMAVLIIAAVFLGAKAGERIGIDMDQLFEGWIKMGLSSASLVMVAVACLVIVVISVILSVQIMEKKEF